MYMPFCFVIEDIYFGEISVDGYKLWDIITFGWDRNYIVRRYQGASISSIYRV